MNDHARDAGSGADPGDDEREVARLLADAGRRAELPAEDLAQVRAVVRAALRGRGAMPAASTLRLLPRRRAGWVAAALAAGLLAAVGIGWWWTLRPRSGVAVIVARVETVAGDVRLASPPGGLRDLDAMAPLAAGVEVRTAGPAGGRPGFAALRLVGGTSVRLDAGSRVRLIGPATVALEEGGLYVDSGTAHTVGIVVRTPLGEVRELGTQFTVRLGAGRRELRVRVREGAVAAAVAGGNHRARAGEELAVDERGRSAVSPAAPSGPAWDWVLAAAPTFASEGRTVRELLEWACRETGWRLRFEGDAAANIAEATVLHGEVGALPADRAPFAVLPGAGLEVELRDGTLLVRAPRDNRSP